MRALTKKANVGEVISASGEQRMATGAKLPRFKSTTGMNSNQIPLEMLRIDRGVEERAAATVPGSIAGRVTSRGNHPGICQLPATALSWASSGQITPVGDRYRSRCLLSTSPSVEGTHSPIATEADAKPIQPSFQTALSA